jgi:hypothetical protein
MNTVQSTKLLIEKYSGGHYDRLTEESKRLTALAWDEYPSQAFKDLVEKAKEINSDWAELISDKGINYFVIAKGDLFCASGFKSQEQIACDTEEWYSEIGKFTFINKSENWYKKWEELSDLIDDFANQVCEEVRNALETD